MHDYADFVPYAIDSPKAGRPAIPTRMLEMENFSFEGQSGLDIIPIAKGGEWVQGLKEQMTQKDELVQILIRIIGKTNEKIAELEVKVKKLEQEVHSLLNHS